jgi:hypothetical protein
VPIKTFDGGLHPNDASAEVEVVGNAIYEAAESFEDLGLDP